jgi:hypothetical protein
MEQMRVLGQLLLESPQLMRYWLELVVAVVEMVVQAVAVDQSTRYLQ